MTCIAYKDGVLAADSKVGVATIAETASYYYGTKIYVSECKTFAWAVAGEVTHDIPHKVLEKHLGVFVAGVESLDELTAFSTFLSFKDYLNEMVKNFNFVVMTKTRLWFVCSEYLMDITGAPFYSVGSGENYARVAMCNGKTAVEAVEFTCQHDKMCGGTVSYVRQSKLKDIKVAK